MLIAADLKTPTMLDWHVNLKHKHSPCLAVLLDKTIST